MLESSWNIEIRYQINWTKLFIYLEQNKRDTIGIYRTLVDLKPKLIEKFRTLHFLPEDIFNVIRITLTSAPSISQQYAKLIPEEISDYLSLLELIQMTSVLYKNTKSDYIK